jgi:hypothetical protein
LNETYFVGNVDEASKQLVRCTYECLEKAIAIGALFNNLNLFYSLTLERKQKEFLLFAVPYTSSKTDHTCNGFMIFELKHFYVQLNLELGFERLEKS